MRVRWQTLVPFLLALAIVLWGLRGARTSDIVDTDAARHAMNGALLLDMARDGGVTHPVQYTKAYYSRYPAISIPYHPPLFPLAEALAFFGLGVSVFPGRLLVALAAGASTVLLYRLVLKTHASHLLALLTTATFLAINGSQRLAEDVMLEYPALALMLVSLHVLTRLETKFTMRDAAAFAIAGAAAVWTKQNVLFAGAIPFAYAVVARKWELFRERAVWAGAALFGTIAAGALLLQKLSPLAANAEWPGGSLARIVLDHALNYPRIVREELGAAAIAAIAVSIGVFVLAKRRSPNDLYIAWAVCAIGLVLVLPPRDVRYLFFAYPALILIGYAGLFAAGRRLLRERFAWAPPVLAGVAWFAAVARPATVFLRGPSDAARSVLASSPRRVLYCGRANGPFIFAVRSLARERRVQVIRGDKLDPAVFGRAAFQTFASEYGIEQIVLERNEAFGFAWDELSRAPLHTMVPVSEIPLTSSEALMRGTLRVFRFTTPSRNPSASVTLRMMNGEDLTVRF